MLLDNSGNIRSVAEGFLCGMKMTPQHNIFTNPVHPKSKYIEVHIVPASSFPPMLYLTYLHGKVQSPVNRNSTHTHLESSLTS